MTALSQTQSIPRVGQIQETNALLMPAWAQCRQELSRPAQLRPRPVALEHRSVCRLTQHLQLGAQRRKLIDALLTIACTALPCVQLRTALLRPSTELIQLRL